jgi:hypothetical protein
MFTGWIYDHLGSESAQVKVAHSAMLPAIAAGNRNAIWRLAHWRGIDGVYCDTALQPLVQKHDENGIDGRQGDHASNNTGPDPKPSVPQLSTSQSCSTVHIASLGSQKRVACAGRAVGRTDPLSQSKLYSG